VSIVAGIESRVDVVESVAVIGSRPFVHIRTSHLHLDASETRRKKGPGHHAPGQELQEISRAGSKFGVDVTPAKRRERKR
jgi:hypothetical protein